MEDTHKPSEAESIRNLRAAALAEDQLKLARKVVEGAGFPGPGRDLLVGAVLQAIALNAQALTG